MNLLRFSAIFAVILVSQVGAYKRKTRLPTTPKIEETSAPATPAILETSRPTKMGYGAKKTRRPTVVPTIAELETTTVLEYGKKTRQPTEVPTIAALETSTVSALPEQTSTVADRSTTTKLEVSPTTEAPLVESTTVPIPESTAGPIPESTAAPPAETTTMINDQTTTGEGETSMAPVVTKDNKDAKKTKLPHKKTPAPTLPPVDFDCRKKDDGYYPDPKDKCSNKWYACVGGLARQLQCASPDLVWEPETNACERREDSYRCTGIRKTTLPSTPRRTQPPPVKLPIDCSKFDDGWFPDPQKKCSHIFYSCSNGIGARFECPGNMYFDKEANMCESFQDVIACAGKHPKTTKKPISTVKPPVTEKLPVDCMDKASGQYADPSKKCSSIYYVCSNGDGYKRSCPEGLYYNAKSKRCDYFDNIFDCSGKTKRPVKPTPAPKPTPASLPSSEFDCKGKDGKTFTPLDKKCSNIYYRCVGNDTYKLKCQDDLFYDIENDRCDFDWNLFVCSGKKPTSPAPVTTLKPVPTEKLPVDCSTREDGDLPDPEKKCSNVYYTCSNHGGSRRLCPEGLYFDSQLRICDVRNNVPDCTGKPRPATTMSPTKRPPVPNKYPFSCEKKGDGNYEAGKCADYYWSCVAGTTVKATCPHNTFYDTELDLCGYKNEIPACGGVRPTPDKSTTEKPYGA